jgi:uncharacterized protein (TIGR02145 family)
LTNITHKTTKATGIGSASGLPQGVTAAWSGGTITISGTPTAAGVFNYTIPITGLICNNVNATGTITVEAACAVGTASSMPTLILNTALENITHTTTKATGIGSALGLPEGVTAAWASNTITISGTPSATGIFIYSIPLTGSTCNNVIATGTITVIPVSACPTTTITYNGYDYKTVGIGTQCWMAENLRTRKYNDGTDIPFDKSENAPGTVKGETWSAWASGAHTIYAHDSTANPSNLTSYGYLYNWYAAAGIITDGGTPSTKNICPSGWHVPTDAEWTTLLDSLGGRSVAGGKLKSILLWNSPNTDADDSSGFSALPGGVRVKQGFGSIKDAAVFWSATEAGDYYGFYGWSFILSNSVGYVNKTNIFFKSDGASVRCLRD